MLASLLAIPTFIAAIKVIAQAVQMQSFQIWRRVENPQSSVGKHRIPIDIAFVYFWLYTIIFVELTINQTAAIHGHVQWTFRQVSPTFLLNLTAIYKTGVQIFPLVTAIQPLLTVYYSIRKYRSDRKRKRITKEPQFPCSTTSTLLPT